jgi:mRNA-degrading endonuclease RelE of RelBE toxin-antitoxin system
MTPRVRERVKEGLGSLEGFPAVKLDLVKVSGESDVYRVRFGKFRALFKVYESEKTIVIVKIDHRKRVYR